MRAETDVITDAVRRYLQESSPDQATLIAKLTVDASLASLGLLDSLNFASLIAFLEQTWNLRVGTEDFHPERFDTLRGIREYVERSRGTSAP